ncbi:MAG: hypothetical protein JXB26_14655 [Candidatus Aminicenantes bacterium]|nr:hypothetical protein [Candidatus Aminicenantes bacterium]
MRKHLVLITIAILLLLVPHLAAKHKTTNFLLLGFSITTTPFQAENAWVVSEGTDYWAVKYLKLGYEIGISHRLSNDPPEYRFKTFFNTKYSFYNFDKGALYAGGGAGVLEIIRVVKLEASLKFVFAFQGILGLRYGPPDGDDFHIEIQFLQSTEKGEGLSINLLAGVAF